VAGNNASVNGIFDFFFGHWFLAIPSRDLPKDAFAFVKTPLI
jgi:hypothetical protein